MPTWLPEPLRDPRRLVPVLIALAVLVGAAVYLPSRSGDKEKIAGAPATQSEVATNETAKSGAPAAAEGGGAQTSGGSSAPYGGTIAGKSAPSGFRASASGKINRNSYQGVTDKKVKLVVSYQSQPCGQDPDAIIQQALPNPDPAGSIAAALKWFSNPQRSLGSDLPRALLDKVGSNSYYGRTVSAVVFNQDHGDFCPEQSRNDAKSVLGRNKPFAIVGGGNEWDEEAVAQKTVKVTGRPATDRFFRERSPYLWGPITGATTINRFLAQYAAKTLAGKNSINTGDARTGNRKRVFGVIYQDTPEINRAKDEFLSYLKQRGVNVSKNAVVGYEPKLSTIGVTSRTIVASLMQEQVTTILMIMDPIAVQFISQAADNQRWLPEWITNTYGLMDWSLGPRSFMSRDQALHTFGISTFWPSKQIREEQTEEYKAWKAINPRADVPSDWLAWYRGFKVFFRGLAAAGPGLTPRTLMEGYNTFCAPCARNDPKIPLTGYGRGDFTAVDDAHIQRYDPDAPDYAAAKDSWENGQPPKGAYVYLNGGKRYNSFE